MNKNLKLVLITGVVSLLFPLVACAAENGIMISPLTYNFEIKAGESKDASVTVTNQSDSALTFTDEVENFTQVSNQGAPSFQEVKPQEGVTTLADWIQFKGDSEQTIPPRGQVTVNFTVNVPQGAEPGGHYAAVFAKQIQKDESGKTQIGVSSRVGTLILVSVPGQTSKTAQLLDFIYKKFVWKGPINFLLSIKNTGTVHYDSPAKVEIKPLFGAKRIIDLGTHTIIPENTREYNADWGSKYPFGYYKLTAVAQDGNKMEMVRQGSIIAIPLLIVLPALVILLVLVLVIKYVKKNFKITSKKSSKE